MRFDSTLHDIAALLREYKSAAPTNASMETRTFKCEQDHCVYRLYLLWKLQQFAARRGLVGHGMRCSSKDSRIR